MRRLRSTPVPLSKLSTSELSTRKPSTSKLSASKFSTLILFLLISAALSFAVSPDRITGAIGARPTIALVRSQHPKAQPQYDRGPVDPSLKLGYMSMLIAPSPSQQKALDQLLEQQQDPASPLFHKWLTPQDYADRFGLSPNDLSKLIAWLTSQGFEIIGTGGGRNLINFSGTAAQVQQAFGTAIHHYDVNGDKHIANSSPVMVPAALGGVVTSVMGLHNFLPRPSNRRASKAQLWHRDYYDANFYFKNFLAPDDIATIYDMASLYTASPTKIDGTGQKLAIVGQTDIFLDDINDF